MKLILLIGALASVAMAAPQSKDNPKEMTTVPVPEEFLPQIVCETSSTSPYNENITTAISMLKRKNPSECKNTNKYKSRCTTVMKTGSVAVGVCGAYDGKKTYPGVGCWQVANYVDWIQQVCKDGSKPENQAGGIFHINERSRAVLFNANDVFVLANMEAETQAEVDAEIQAEMEAEMEAEMAGTEQS